MSHDCALYAQDRYTAQALAHEATFAAMDAAKFNAREAARNAECMAAEAPFVSPNGPWINDGDRWCCDYCNANPRAAEKLPKTCHACGSIARGGIMAKECAL